MWSRKRKGDDLKKTTHRHEQKLIKKFFLKMQKIPDNFLNTKKPQHRSPKTRVTLSPLQTQKVSEPSNRRLFTLHYIPANVHVGSNIERIPQDKHTRQKNWGLRKIPSGLVRAGADADDVAL